MCQGFSHFTGNSVRIRRNLDYAFRNCMYWKGQGPSILSGQAENPGYTQLTQLSPPMLRLYTFVQRCFVENIWTLSCWYPLDSSQWELSKWEHSVRAFRRVSLCQGFSHFFVSLHQFVMTKSATTSIRINPERPVKEASTKIEIVKPWLAIGHW